MSEQEIERIRKLAEALRKEAGHEDKEFPEPDGYCPHAGGDFSRSCAEALDALLAEHQLLRDALQELARAAIAYDAAIQACANDPDTMASHCTAEGDTLDSLYDTWITAARAALSGEAHD